MKVANTRYIYPPRPTTAVPREATGQYATFGWIAQYKYNDARTLIKYLPTDTTGHTPIELWGRKGEKLKTYHVPDWLLDQLHEVHTHLGLNTNEWSLLDGGLLDFKHEAIKDTIVLWDILVKDGEHLLGTTYKERYDQLHAITSGEWYYHPPHKKHQPLPIGKKITDNILIPYNLTPDKWDDAWDTIDIANTPYLEVGKGPILEGLVFKDPNGTLENGWREKNNTGWCGRSRITTGRHRF